MALAVHVVAVSERETPPGEEPIEWRLITTEPVDTVDQVLRIVEWYRTRWVIEEFFKALKTGCAYEKRQLESLATLVIALALLAPIAWQLLLLRHLARRTPAGPRDGRAVVASAARAASGTRRRTARGAADAPRRASRDRTIGWSSQTEW